MKFRVIRNVCPLKKTVLQPARRKNFLNRLARTAGRTLRTRAHGLLKPGECRLPVTLLGARWLEPRLQKLGLAVAQVPVFGAIKSLGQLSQKELARLLYVEQPTMAQLLARMERDGLIVRTPDLNDGRSSVINLTSQALKKAEPARDVLLQGRRIAFKGLSPRDIATLNRLLQRVLKNLEEAVDD